MSQVGAIFVPFPSKAGKNLLHPRPLQSLNGSLVVLSARARNLTPKLSVASAPLGRVSERTVTAYRPLQATSARHRLSAQGPHRVQTSIIVWGGSREDQFRKHRNDNSEAPTWARRVGKATQGSQNESYLAIGAVLGGLSPEKPRSLWDDPAQRQRTEVGCIRSCCQGWTRLDDCCDDRGHVARGGREGSGSPR